jgi:hypothetical protein
VINNGGIRGVELSDSWDTPKLSTNREGKMAEFTWVCTAVGAIGSVFAAVKGICPDPTNPKCDPIRGISRFWVGLVIGLIVFVAFYFLCIGDKKPIDCCHYLAMLATSYLFGHFVNVFSRKK